MSDTRTMSIADFLLARYAEDEAKANDFLEAYARAKNGEAGGHVGEWYGGWWAGAEATGFTPQRILAECNAKRRIVQGWTTTARRERRPTGTPGRYDVVDVREPLCEIDGDVLLGLLALPYADHPDYRGEWKP